MPTDAGAHGTECAGDEPRRNHETLEPVSFHIYGALFILTGFLGGAVLPDFSWSWKEYMETHGIQMRR